MARAWDIIHADDDTTDEDAIRMARFCSRDRHENGRTTCSGDTSSWCFRCIMEAKWSLLEKRNALTKVLSNPKFLNAEGDNGNIQVMLLTEVHGVLLQGRALRLYDSGRMFSNDVSNYLEFLNGAGLCEALPKLAKVRIPVSPDREYDRQWYSVGYYCVSIPGLVARMEASSRFVNFGIKPDPKYCKRMTSAKNEFIQRVIDAGMIRDVLGMISGSHGLIELLRAPWTLKGVISSYPDACSYLVDADGISTLCKMFMPGVYQQVVASRIKGGLMNYDRTLLGVDHGGGTRPATNPFKMSNKDLIKYLGNRTVGALEDVGSVLITMCKSNRGYCMQLLDDSPSVMKWLRWMKVPLLEAADILGIKVAAKLLLTVLEQGEKPVHTLVESYNLIDLLEKVLYLPNDTVLGTFMKSLQIVLSISGKPRRMAMISVRILYAVSCLIHTSSYTLQVRALEILNDMLKSDAKRLLLMLIDKQLLRKVQVVVGIAATTRDKEMHAQWKQLDESITKYCDKYMELAADDDRLRIRQSKVLTTPDKVDTRQDVLRKRGNVAFADGRYLTAIEEYTVGILVASMPSCEVDAVLYSNRSECHLRLHMYEKAVFDATRAINCMFKRSSVYSKTCFRRAKAFFALERYYEAFNDVAVCVKENPKEEKFQELYKNLTSKWKNGEFVDRRVEEKQDSDWNTQELRKEIERREKERQMEKDRDLDKGMKQMLKSRWEEKVKEMEKDKKVKAEEEEKKLQKKKNKLHVCADCGREASGMKKCARCSTYFCDKACQSKAWPKHKLVCK